MFYAGHKCRNNLGQWKTEQITVDSKLKGRDFYTQKDKAMAAVADFGFVAWDGKSAGSITNVLELLQQQKYAVVFFAPKQFFHNIKQVGDLHSLLTQCDPQAITALNKKIKLETRLAALETSPQLALGL